MTQSGDNDSRTLGFTFHEDEPPTEPTTELPPVPSVTPGAPTPAVGGPGQPYGQRPATAAADPAAPAPQRQRPNGWTVVGWGLAVLALALAGWLWYVADSWQEQATELRRQATSARNDAVVLEQERNDARTQLEQRTAELAHTQTELDQTNQRISELANEKAQATDQEAVATQLAQQASQIATGLQQCSDGQNQLISYVTAAPGTYDPNQVVQYAQQVQAACAAARSANDQLQVLVAKLGG